MKAMIRSLLVVMVVWSGFSRAEEKIPHWMPVSEILKAYETNELKADLSVKGPGKLIFGRVVLVKRDLLDQPTLFLGDSELNAVRCTFAVDSSQPDLDALAELTPGQVVAVSGTGEGRALRQVRFSGCHIVWVPTRTKNTELLGLSTMHCMFQKVRPSLEKDQSPKAVAFRKDAERAGKVLDARLKKTERGPLDCDEPSLWVVFRCDGEKFPECKDPTISAALKSYIDIGK